jgi:hypothetical protein
MHGHNVKILRRMLARDRDAILEPFAEDLLAQRQAVFPKSFDEVAWLRERGVICRKEDVRHFLDARERRLAQKEVLGRLRSRADRCAEFQKLVDSNPVPNLEALIKVHRFLTFELATRAECDLAVINMVDQMTRTVIYYETDKAKFAQREQFLKLTETKVQIDICKQVLEKVTLDVAEKIATSDMSQAEKIAAMRRAAFIDVEVLQQSGQLKIPE